MPLTALLSRLSGRHVVVIGDVMLDHFLIGQVDRISPEAPVPVVRFARDEYRLGGAANVAHNVASLGGRVTLVGIVGADAAADRLRREMTALGLSDAGLVTDATRPTTCKVRVVTMRNQQVARVDYEHDGDATGATLSTLVDRVAGATRDADAIVLSDYRKGTITPEVIAAASAAARAANIPLLVDPKVPQPDRYKGATLITPNHHEAEVMTQMAIRGVDDMRRASRWLSDRTGASVVVTWGEHGMWVLDRSGATTREESLAASAREVSDVTGAGDTVISVLALGLAAGAPIGDAARLANLAAGLVVARFGPAAPTLEELRAAVAALDR